MSISVIVPSYKPGDYLWACLDSLCNQSLSEKDFEVIIVLNGCNQPYASQIEDYISNHQKHYILLRQTDTPGVSNARNIGIEEAHGEYVCFVDDDDLVSSTYLEDLLKVSSPNCIGCATMKAFSCETSENKDTFISLAYSRCKNKSFSFYEYRQFLSPPVCKLIHHDIIREARFPSNLKQSEDSVFCFDISKRINQLKLANESAVYYQRLREGSAMRKYYPPRIILGEFAQIEFAYISLWLKNPFKYNLKFFMSRLIAASRNTYWRFKRSVSAPVQNGGG